MEHTPDLSDAVVELTAPDGRVFRFRYGATLPYAGQDYVVLLELEDDPSGQEQILVTRLEEEDGQLSFVVAEEEDVIEQVFNKYVALSLQNAVTGIPEDGCGCHEDGCGCHEDGCGCHQDGCGCHEDGCDGHGEHQAE